MDVSEQVWPILQTHLSGVITVLNRGRSDICHENGKIVYNKYSTKGHIGNDAMELPYIYRKTFNALIDSS